MIAAVARTAATALRRDRAALALSFLLPIAFFTIFALVFGGRRETPRVRVAVADADHSRASEALLRALGAQGLELQPRPTAAAAEAAVKAGDTPVALVVPEGFERGASGDEAPGSRIAAFSGSVMAMN